MYVCLCNGYRESELRAVAVEGVTVAEDAYTVLGNGPCCGQCLEVAQDIIDDACRGLVGSGVRARAA